MSISCPMCPNMIRSSINLSSHLRTHSFVPRRRTTPRMTRQAGHDRGTWLCIMHSVLFTKKHNQRRPGRKGILASWSLMSLRCTHASSVLPNSGQGRSWKSTRELGMLGKGPFPVAWVERPSTPIRTCPTMSRGSTESC